MLRLTTLLFLASASLLAVIHALALQTSLYWRFSWFDIPVHFLGGVVIVFMLATLRDLHLVKYPPIFKLAQILFIYFVFAIGWEIFGVIMEQGFKDNYFVDTTTDIAVGLLGAIVAFFAARSLYLVDIWGGPQR